MPCNPRDGDYSVYSSSSGSVEKDSSTEKPCFREHMSRVTEK